VVAVTTQHNDAGRTGANLQETRLTTSNVRVATFGKVFQRQVDGRIYAQPLYVPRLTIPGKGRHNVVFVATMHNSAYAFDADNPGAALPLWHRALEPSATLPDQNIGFNCGVYKDIIAVEIGTISTPAISLTTRTLYLVTFTRQGPARWSGPCVWQRTLVHRLDRHRCAATRQRAFLSERDELH
jgi:hypothetical protein